MKKLNISRSIVLVLILTLVFMFAVPTSINAIEPTVNLGTTENFAVLAGTTITNTGSTIISGSVGGDIGVYSGSAIIGFPPGIVSDGTIHTTDAIAQQAQDDLVIAYDDAASRTVTQDLTGQDLGGLTLTTGVYFFSTSAQLTGTLTLDAQGNPDAVFIFQIGSTLTTATGSVVNLINGARFCRIFWQVGSSATLGTSTQFVGHIFALSSITANTSATVQGQLLARNGAVTLDSNTITNGVCEAAATPTVAPTVAPTISPTLAPNETPTIAPTIAPTVAPTATPTIGGDLPDTASPWLSILLVGAAISICGLLILRSKKRYE